MHSAPAAKTPPEIPLWAGHVPGEVAAPGEEKDLTKENEGLVAGQRVIRLGNVSKPTIAVYSPPADKNTGTAVLVCPGGGYYILAMDLEGTEVCKWLNSIGVTGVLLKYRVPKPASGPAHVGPLQDAQRALGLLRSRAKEFKVDPDRIGVLGFSAGGNLAALLSNHYQERTYPLADDADHVSCRPDFSILIYPAYLTVEKEGDKVSPDLPLTTNTPPTFMVMAQDDPVRAENVLGYSTGLQRLKVPFELHVYPTGGHGYGLRRTPQMVTTWPDRAGDWMRSRGWLTRP